MISQNATELLSKLFETTARSLESTYRNFGYLNGRQNAPIPERNTVVHLAAALIKEEFYVYAEPSLKRENKERIRRIDLFASNRDFTFVFEVKAFGRRNFSTVLADAERICDYIPNTENYIDSPNPDNFWKNSKRFGVLVIQSSEDDRLFALWQAQVDDQEDFERKLQGKCAKKKKIHYEFKELADFLRERNATTCSSFVCEKLWEKTSPLHLLWAAFELEAKDTSSN